MRVIINPFCKPSLGFHWLSEEQYLEHTKNIISSLLDYFEESSITDAIDQLNISYYLYSCCKHLGYKAKISSSNKIYVQSFHLARVDLLDPFLPALNQLMSFKRLLELSISFAGIAGDADLVSFQTIITKNNLHTLKLQFGSKSSGLDDYMDVITSSISSQSFLENLSLSFVKTRLTEQEFFNLGIGFKALYNLQKLNIAIDYGPFLTDKMVASFMSNLLNIPKLKKLTTHLRRCPKLTSKMKTLELDLRDKFPGIQINIRWMPIITEASENLGLDSEYKY